MSIRLKNEETQGASDPKPTRSRRAKPQANIDVAALRAEIKAEIMAELGLTGVENKSPAEALKGLVGNQVKAFTTMNPVDEGWKSYELVDGRKLVRVTRKMDGTKIKNYIGNIKKHDFAKEELEKAKKTGNIEYR